MVQSSLRAQYRSVTRAFIDAAICALEPREVLEVFGLGRHPTKVGLALGMRTGKLRNASADQISSYTPTPQARFFCQNATGI